MTAIAELVAVLISTGIPPETVKSVVEFAQQHANEQVDFHRNSTGIPPETAYDRRKKYDRERKRKNAEIEKNALTDTSFLSSTSASQEGKKEESKKEGAREQKKRGERLSNSWAPNAKDWATAEMGLGAGGAALELEKFRDWWAAKAGSGGVKLDWDATWRTWIRTAMERRQHRPNGSVNGGVPRPGSKDDTRERTVNALDELREYNNAHADDTSGGGEADRSAPRRLPFAESA